MILASLLLLTSSCVHEWPEDVSPRRSIILNITHSQGWNQHEMTVTRAENPGVLARFHFQIFNAGSATSPIAEYVFTSSDLDRKDFSMAIELCAGSYDLYAWSDYCDINSGISLYFNTSDFTSIHYTEPYQGNNETRDAFRGMISFTVENTLEAEYHQTVELQLERPLARYEFRATDIMKFIEQETTRGELTRDAALKVQGIDKYRVNMIYTGYMPSKFNNILNRPVDSMLGMRYNANIVILSDSEEARLGFDYVMVNGHESSIPVALEVYNTKGEMIARTNSINVPTQRACNTIIRGKFLTSMATGGIGISPDFDGDFNIEIR